MFATDWKQLTVLFLSITKNIMKFIQPSVRPQIKTGTCVVNLPSIPRKSAIGPDKLIFNQAGNFCQTCPRPGCIGGSWLCPALQLSWLLSQTRVQASALRCQWPLLPFSLPGGFCSPLCFVSSSVLKFEVCCHIPSERIILNYVCFSWIKNAFRNC